jgi:hypothetical protein
VKTVLSIVACLFLASATVVVLVLGGDLHRTMIDADSLIVREVADLHGTAQNVNAVLLQAGLTADEARRAATEQRTYWRQTAQQTDHLITEADKNLNQAIFPATAALIKESDAWLQETANDAQTLTVAANTGFDSITHDADALHERLADPQISELLGRFNVLALHLDNISDNAEAMSGDMRLAVHRMAAPPSKFHTFLDASYTTLKFGSLFIP